MTEFETLTRIHGSRLLAELVCERRRIQNLQRKRKRHKLLPPPEPPEPAYPPDPPGPQRTLEQRVADLEQFINTLMPVDPQITQIQKLACAHFKISKDDLLSLRRGKSCIARWAAMYLASRFTQRSLPEIARMFAGRDHTTIMHAIMQTDLRMKEDAVFAADIECLKRKIVGER